MIKIFDLSGIAGFLGGGMNRKSIFNRDGSTLGIMDDLQFAVHSYDGCGRGCPGCIVDRNFKNKLRFKPIIQQEDIKIIDSRVMEYYDWVKENLNTKDSGYFGKNGYKVLHHSYTFRFGNHSELEEEDLLRISLGVNTNYRVFSVAPPSESDLMKFSDLKKECGGMVLLEIIYDPFEDDSKAIRDSILWMKSLGLNGYPELLITKKLISQYTPRLFYEQCILPMADANVQIQFGHYVPSRTRNFNLFQTVSLDEEVEWLTEVARYIIEDQVSVYPIPLGEYAVTLLDEYNEISCYYSDNGVDVSRLPPPEPFDILRTSEKIRDIFITSLYIDHNLDVFVWSESMGQHVLDKNFGFNPIGNLRNSSIIEMVNKKGGELDNLINLVIRDLLTNKKCYKCRYKSFCASHAVPLFRKWRKDDGVHCYGYIPVIREFQRNIPFLHKMIEVFREIGF